jgi:GMP synthase (glutamine-hydrolysing)
VQADPTRGVRRILVVEHEQDADLGRLLRPLLVAPGVELDVVRPYEGQVLPADAEAAGYHGLIVLGGSMASWEDDVAPWLPATRLLLGRAVETALPVLGICLGAQLLALATGGGVQRGQADLEVGLGEIVYLAEAATDRLLGPVMARSGTRAFVGQWHQDAIDTLPPGAVLLATGQPYPHQAFRLGEAAWGLQYHPEVTSHGFGLWLADGAEAVTLAGEDPVLVGQDVREADTRLEALAVAHAEAFAAIVTT